jgi:hypothetical protein
VEDKAFIPIRFEAWKYENEDNLLYPLLYAVKSDYQARISNPIDRGFQEKMKEVTLTGTLALSDIGVRAVTKATTGEGFIPADLGSHFEALHRRADEIENALSGWADEVRSLQDDFGALLDLYAADWARELGQGMAKENVRFVILVDDLDRCRPQTAITFLESIKNFLSIANCLFVLALNPRALYQGIQAKYAMGGADGRQYLEKMINYSFYVPEPQPEQASRFAREALAELVGARGGSDKKWSVWFDEFGQVIRDCAFTNPRKIKRILNHYLFFLNLHDPEKEGFYQPNIIRLIILAEYYPTLYQALIGEAEQALSALKSIGNAGFKLDLFEEQFGVSIRPVYADLRDLRGLCDLAPVTELDRPSLHQHVQAVYQIVHPPI